jgi:hypothetical protein
LEEKLNLLLKLWFNLNILSLNYDKTCCMKFAAKRDYTYTLNIKYNSKGIHETDSATCLGMTPGSTVSWRNHIESLKGRLNKACYIIRKSKQFLSITALNDNLWFDLLG